MNLPKRAMFIGGGLLIAFLAFVLMNFGGGGYQDAQATHQAPYYVCYDPMSGTPLGVSVSVGGQFPAANVTLGQGSWVCVPHTKNFQGELSAPILRCYSADDDPPGPAVDIKNQFETRSFRVGRMTDFCVPAQQNTVVGKPTEPFYVCYEDPSKVNMGDSVVLFNKVTDPANDIVTVLDADLLCVVTLKSGAGNDDAALYPPMSCYNFDPTVPGGPLNLFHQYAQGGEPVDLTGLQLLCVPDEKVIKPSPTGSLSGISDVLGYLSGDKNLQAFYCKTRTDDDTATNQVKTASTCFSDTPGQAAPGDKVPTDPNIDLSGPPPPPPYGEAGPQKGLGSYDPGTDTLTTTTCLGSLGGTLGPNVILAMTILNAKATLPSQSGSVDLYFGQGINACNALTPVGSPTQSLQINITTYDTPLYDKFTSIDSDGDGCADAFELDKTRAFKDCGDDPWNPHDSDLNFSGIFTVTVEVVRADTCPGTAGPPPIGCDGAAAGDIVAGSYFNCQAVLDFDKNTLNITGRAFCYTDNPVTAVNVEDNGGVLTCAPFPSATPGLCGDGLPGSPPPGPFADNNGVNTPGVITGVFDKEKNKLFLDVCFQDIDQPLIGPFAYALLEVDAHTMLGTASIWLQRMDCAKPDENNDPPDNFDVPVALGEQESDYDVDQDGCTTAEELGVDPFSGGQRDPYNKYDHMDINKDGFIGIPDDFISVAAMFGASVKGAQGNVGPRMVGSVPWAHRNGDIAINIPDDILGMAAQFGHNCDGTP